MERVEVSVSVATFNRAEMLHCALGSLIRQETDGAFSYEIVVTDDGSTDHTREVVQKVAARSQVLIRYVRGTGGGVVAARNMGVAEACGRWIVFFDDDQLAEVDWLKTLMATTLERGADCVGGTRLLDLPQGQLSRLGPVCRSLLGENLFGNRTTRLRGKSLPTTGNLLISRTVFDAIGVFDASLLNGGEDMDLLIRARAAGFEIWIDPKAVVYHLVPQFRLQSSFFQLASFRWGTSFACTDFKRRGHCQMLMACIARMGKALLVNIPYLLLANLKRNMVEILDCKCLLWRAQGYIRQCLFITSPKLFPQIRFFSVLNYRNNHKLEKH